MRYIPERQCIAQGWCGFRQPCAFAFPDIGIMKSLMKMIWKSRKKPGIRNGFGNRFSKLLVKLIYSFNMYDKRRMVVILPA